VSHLLYLYAILPANAPAAETLLNGGLTGIDGAPVGGVESAGLVAAASEVPAADFEAGPLNSLVRSMDWLGPRATLHQDVNAALFAQTDAQIPLAFGTVYRHRSGILTMLNSQQQAFHALLDRVRGRAEWVASLQRLSQQALAALEDRSETLHDLRSQIAEGAPGRAYLLTRQVATVQRRELQIQDGLAVTALETLLSDVENVVPERLEAGSDTGVLARLSLLVRRNEEARWLAAVDNYQQHWLAAGYELRVTGPWPPYRFTSGAELQRVGT